MGKLGPTPAARRARSAWASTGSAWSRARFAAPRAASPTCLRALAPGCSSDSRSPITLLVCSRPRCTRLCTIDCASSAVTRPRSTASFTTSSMRSRVIMMRLSGRMTPFVIASRSSATFLPEKSRLRAVEAADSPAVRAPFCAFCCRARALPPALAARLRAAVLRVEEPERELDDEREVDEERRPLEELVPLRELALRELEAREPELREPELREPVLREALVERRPPPELDDDLRDDDPPDDFLRDEPPPLLPLDSAIAILPQKLGARWVRAHYMPTAAVTYA